MRKLKLQRSTVVLIAMFLVTFVASFLVWPAEKIDYSSCKGTVFCAGTPVSTIGGGLTYVQHINEFNRDTESQTAAIQRYESDDKGTTYLFAPTLVAGISGVVAVGVTSIGFIVRRVIRRRAAFLTTEPKTD